MGRDPQVFADITQVYDGIVSSFLTNSDNLSDDEVVNILMEIKPFIDDLGIDTVGRVVQTCANEGNHKSIPSLLRQSDAAQSNPSDPPQNERNADAPLTFIESEKKEKPKSDAKKPEPAPNKEKKKKKGFFSKLFGSKKSKTDEKEDSKEKSREEEKKNQHAHSPQKKKKGAPAENPPPPPQDQEQPILQIEQQETVPPSQPSNSADNSALQPTESYVSRAQIDAMLAEQVRKAEEEMNKKYDFSKSPQDSTVA